MFGLSETVATRSSLRGKWKGVVLVRGQRRASWLAGWTVADPAAEPSPRTGKPAVVPEPPAADRKTQR